MISVAQIKASLFKNKFDNQPETFDTSWTDLVEWWRELSEQLRRRAEKDGDELLGIRASTPAICPAEYEPGALRRKVNVQRWWFFACDIDNEDPEAMLTREDAVVLMRHWNLGYVIHSSTKSREDQHRYRLIFKLSRPIEMGEYEQVWASVNAMFAGIFDVKTRDPSRLFYVPARWENSFWFFEAEDGQGLDVDQVVLDYPVKVEPMRAIPELPVIVERPKPKSDKLEGIRAKLLGLNTMGDVIDPVISPFVTENMRMRFATSPKGGRFFAFMVAAAQRALEKGYAISVVELEALAITMDRMNGGYARRENSKREAARALAFATANPSEDRQSQIRDRRREARISKFNKLQGK